MSVKIVKIDYYLPETLLTSDDLEREFQNCSSDKIEKKLGIRERHI